MKTLLQSLRVLFALTVLTGVLYPLAVWAVGRGFFRRAAEGSLINRNGRVVGSDLLAQKTDDPRYFHPRPSAGDYATVASGASNLAWTNAKLAAAVAERRVAAGAGEVPAELLTASGGGLDPHLSPAGVRTQAARVAAARALRGDQLRVLDGLVDLLTEKGQLGPDRVNVLRLNLALDDTFPP